MNAGEHRFQWGTRSGAALYRRAHDGRIVLGVGGEEPAKPWEYLSFTDAEWQAFTAWIQTTALLPDE